MSVLFSCPADALRVSAASTMSLTARVRFGFLSAEMASWSSASICAFFCALISAPLKLTLREKILVGRSLNEPASALGIRPIKVDSLASRFRPGITVWLADRKRAIVAAGPRETLRRLRSTERARSRVLCLSRFAAAGRFIGAPGFDNDAEVSLVAFSFGGDCATGPPSLRLRESHGPGSRAEKLLRWVSELIHGIRAWTIDSLQWHNNIHAEISQGVRVGPFRFLSLVPCGRHLRLRHGLDLV